MLLSPQGEILDRTSKSATARPLRVVLAVNSFLPHVGGREMVVHYLAKSLVDMGHQVRVFLKGGAWRYRNCRYPYAVHRWPGLGGYLRDWAGQAALRWESSAWKTDLIHAHVTYPTGYWAVQIKNRRGIPVVITPHGDDIHTIPEIGHGKRLDPGCAVKITQAVSQADRVTAISESIAHSLLEAGAAPDHIRRIPNGIDLERFQGKAEIDVRERYGLPADAKLVLSVGSYIPRRGFEYLVRAMALVRESFPEAILIIAGRNTEILEPLVAELGLKQNVCFPGQIAPPTNGGGGVDLLAEIYKSSDAYVSSGMSEGSEGLSLALLDAMASGLPAVATAISGNRDVVRNGKSGWLVPARDVEAMADGIKSLLGDPEMASRFGAEALSISQEYSWENAARKYVALYSELIASKSSCE